MWALVSSPQGDADDAGPRVRFPCSPQSVHESGRQRDDNETGYREVCRQADRPLTEIVPIRTELRPALEMDEWPCCATMVRNITKQVKHAKEDTKLSWTTMLASCPAISL